MNIIIRKDLKMRKGKMAAQSAHASMKLFLEVMQRKDNKFILDNINTECLKQFLDKPNVEVIFTENEDTLNAFLSQHNVSTSIIDHGRTEFHNIKTKTCGATGLFESNTNHEIIPEEERDILAKQIIIFSKEFPLSKENACKLSSVGCLDIMFSLMEYKNNSFIFDLTKKCALTDWLTNAFAKISLSTKNDEELNNVANELRKAGVKFKTGKIDNNMFLITEPTYKEDIDLITGKLSLI